MKKTTKILSIILVMMIAIMALSTGVMATEIIDDLTDHSKNPVEGQDKLIELGGNIIGIITTIGIVISVIVLLIIGIKYMMGSASEKAEYKKTMIPYLVGAFIIFGASAIAKVVVAMTQNLTGSN